MGTKIYKINDVGSAVYEFESLEAAIAAYQNLFGTWFEDSKVTTQPGLRQSAIIGFEYPWFYEKPDREISFEEIKRGEALPQS